MTTQAKPSAGAEFEPGNDRACWACFIDVKMSAARPELSPVENSRGKLRSSDRE